MLSSLDLNDLAEATVPFYENPHTLFLVPILRQMRSNVKCCYIWSWLAPVEILSLLCYVITSSVTHVGAVAGGKDKDRTKDGDGT